MFTNLKSLFDKVYIYIYIYKPFAKIISKTFSCINKTFQNKKIKNIEKLVFNKSKEKEVFIIKFLLIKWNFYF